MAEPSRSLSSMTLPLGDGIVTVTRWSDGTATPVIAAKHADEPAEKLAEKLEQLARFVRGGVQ